MQPITPTLLAAATRLEGEPIAQAILEDRRIRWALAHSQESAPDAPLAQYDSGNILLRATTAAGNLQVARVTDRTSATAWETFSIIAADARPDGDVAVAWIPLWTWLLAYESTGHQVFVRISTDDGLSWSAATVLHVASVTPWVAAWNHWVFVLEEHLHAYHWDGTGWLGPYTLQAATPSAGGVAAYYDPGAQWAHILYSAGGRLYKVEFDTAAMAYTTPRGLAPGGDQPASSVAQLRLPSLTRVMDLGLVATWVERYSAPLEGWGGPVSAIARDDNAQHFGQVCPLAPSDISVQRWHLAYDSASKRLYAGNRRRTITAPVFDADVHTWMSLGPLDVLTYRCMAMPHSAGKLMVELLDPTFSYRNPGSAGSGAEVAKLLAAVRIRRGYRTAQGTETVDTPNYYITQATFTDGQGGGRLCLIATDAFGLLDLWHPVEPIVWYGRSIRWLLEEICSRVGLVALDTGVTSLGITLPHFAIYPQQSGLAAVRTLLRLGQAVARASANDALAILTFPGTDATWPEIGIHGEIHTASYGCSLQPTNHVRVASAAYDLYAQAEDIAAAQTIGQRFSSVLEDNRIPTASVAEAVAVHYLRLLAASHTAHVTVPLRPDLEPWDGITLHADGLPKESYVLEGLEEEAMPVRNRYTSRLRLKAIPL